MLLEDPNERETLTRNWKVLGIAAFELLLEGHLDAIEHILRMVSQRFATWVSSPVLEVEDCLESRSNIEVNSLLVFAKSLFGRSQTRRSRCATSGRESAGERAGGVIFDNSLQRLA
jgi:hypothetical protein